MQYFTSNVIQGAINIANLLFPPLCIICQYNIDEMGGLCPKCWDQIVFHCDPSCTICGQPFEYDIGAQMLCISCLTSPPYYKKSHIVFKYNEFSKEIIHKLKYNDQTYLAPYLAKWLFNKAFKILLASDILIPVPLHKFKLLMRLYNQSLLLAQELHLLSKIPLNPHILKRVNFRRSQTRLKCKERNKNVEGAFKISTRYNNILKGKKVVLIDDVITTGATMNECTKLLLAAGAAEVNVLVLAKTFI